MKAFLAVTCYYVSIDWEYREVLLGFEPVSGSHTGYNLALIVEQVLQQFSLTNRLFAITADNASNNQTMRTSLENMLHAQGITWDAEAMTVSCLPHVLNLSAKVFLAGLNLHYDDEIYGAEDPDPDDFDIPDNLLGAGATVAKVM
jgi:hypothetical protein